MLPTCSGLLHRPAHSPLVLVRVVSLNAGQVGNTVVPPDHEDEAQHDPDAKICPFFRHWSYCLPGVLARIVTLHAAEADKQQRSKKAICKKERKIRGVPQEAVSDASRRDFPAVWKSLFKEATAHL